MDTKTIASAIEKAVNERRCFLVEVTVSPDNDIVVAVESETGSVQMDDCIAINDAFLTLFDRDVEDYSLTVTSAGLDQPFKVLKQYKKALGSKVEVKVRGGKKFVAILEDADEESVTLKYSVKETVEGKKKKELVEHVDKISMAEINSVMPHIDFE